jgi:hypothetical protein
VGYLVPIIFYRQIERAQGSPDNALLGFNFKALALKRLQFYGQFLLDEFKAKELTAGNGWWGNKFGAQIGGKYFDAFGIKNLDLQAEMNIVRPFTYSHNDTVANYTHYNQPLAHPLGAGFAEFIGRAMYQPAPKVYLTLYGMFYRKGIDTGAHTSGFNIFRGNNDRAGEYGYQLTGAVPNTTMLANFNASYELRENLFIDLGVTHRRSETPGLNASASTTIMNAGLRLNFIRRDYNFY